jgi:non-homologous end joining protein Ku
LKQQNVDSETGELVPREDMARGYEVAKGQYLIVEDKEFEAIQIESTRTIDIDQFVPRNEIDERYIDRLTTSHPMVRSGRMPLLSSAIQSANWIWSRSVGSC